jgi:hypothetical protein
MAMKSRPFGGVVYVTGGRQRSRIDQDWGAFKEAAVLRIDLVNGGVERFFTYASPPEVCADPNPSIVFKCGSISDRALFLCSETEVFGLDLRTKRIFDYISLPCFNDIHHVLMISEGQYLVANSGLDMVLEVLNDGTIVRDWSVIDSDVWNRFSRDVDYRKIRSTKPHFAHPNFVFLHDGDFWVTRFEQRDALCLTKKLDPIHVGFAGPHDGLRHASAIYFTTVDGHIVEIDAETLEMRRSIDLNGIEKGTAPLGWCRGVLVVDEVAWVGFSRLRDTRVRRNLRWAKRGFRPRSGYEKRPTRLAAYDLERRVLLEEINLEPYDFNAVFSILPETQAESDNA